MVLAAAHAFAASTAVRGAPSTFAARILGAAQASASRCWPTVHPGAFEAGCPRAAFADRLQCQRCMPRCIAENSCSSGAAERYGFAGRVDPTAGCRLCNNHTARSLDNFERQMLSRKAEHGAPVLSLWNGLGGDLAGLSEHEHRPCRGLRGRALTEVPTAAPSHRSLQYAQPLAVAVGAPTARSTG